MKQYQLVRESHSLHVAKYDQLRKAKNSSVQVGFMESVERLYGEFEEEHGGLVDDRAREMGHLNDMIEFIREEERQKDQIQNDAFS